ncbi:hypothetical protein GCM10010232_26660 [Streptomyces amakusaensis]|uniref:Uncharacterized protein n=1 Tax=Streptomyces amakusaensis TaxID=67271 RepID=A0ABW0AJK9_9ACTN
MSDINKEVREHTSSQEFLTKLKKDLGLENLVVLKGKGAPEEKGEKEGGEKKEEDKFPYEEFGWKGEHGYGKFENVGVIGAATVATGTASAVSADLTGASSSIRLVGWDKSILNEAWDGLKGQTPEQLRKELSQAQEDIKKSDADILRLRGKVESDRTELETDIGNRVRNLSQELEGKIRLKADKSAVQSTNSTQNRDIGSLSETAHRAGIALSGLEERLRVVESRL